MNDPNVRHENHQLSSLKRLQTQMQSSDTVDINFESKPEQSTEHTIDTTPDKKQNMEQYEKALLGLPFLEAHKLDRVRNILEFVKILMKQQLMKSAATLFSHCLVTQA